MVTFEDVKTNIEFKTYIKASDTALKALGFTDHSSAHTMRVALHAGRILKELSYSSREVELACIAAYTHDIGNMVNRTNHAHTGAIIVFDVLTRMGMEASEIATIVTAIGNHDESTGAPVSAVSAALIIADKTDVKRIRVNNSDISTFDIHDRVNYAAIKDEVVVDKANRIIRFSIEMDKKFASLSEYFTIFLDRKNFVAKACNYLKCDFQFYVDGILVN